MFVVPVPADEFLPFAIRAIESEGHAGLFIVLARTADSREQHEELTRDWTSIHDVTGPLLAVLCPDPKALQGRAVVYNRMSSTGIGVEGLDTGTWPFDPRDAAAIELLTVQYRDHGGRAVRPSSARAHKDAWSEATSRCARYFGIAEGSLPSLLVLSYWERAAILISLGSDTSIYEICKSVVDRLGSQLDDIVRTKAAQEVAASLPSELCRKSHAWDTEQRRVMLPYAEWQEQLGSLDRHIAMLEGTFPNLVMQARSSLARLMADEAVGSELCEHLRALDTAVNERDFSESDVPTRRIHNKIWKVAHKLESGEQERPLPERVNPHRPLLASAQAEIERLDQQLREQVSGLQLSRTVQESVMDLYRVEEDQSPPRLLRMHGWTLRVFRQRGRADLPLRTART